MPIPAQIGKYQIKRELGRGAMGVVYVGFDLLIERAVAIKTVLKSAVSESEAQEIFGRFRREAQAAGRLTHPNIVSIYEYGEDQDIAFIAMELVAGMELKSYFDGQHHFEIPACVDIMQQLLDALDYSHSRGVVHRDIKPANILITELGQVKIADFGIAKIESAAPSQAGMVMGTPAYMSPEQLRGAEVDHRSDIYSAGVILYQFLTGKKPFSEATSSDPQKLTREKPPAPNQVKPELSKALSDVVLKAMAPLAQDRYASAAEFKTALLLATNTPLVATRKNSVTDTRNSLTAPEGSADDPTVLMTSRAERRAKPRLSEYDIWMKIKGGDSLEDLQRFIKFFPNGEFTAQARQMVTRLEVQSRQIAEAQRQSERAEIYAKLKTAADAAHQEEKAAQERRNQRRLAALAPKRSIPSYPPEPDIPEPPPPEPLIRSHAVYERRTPAPVKQEHAESKGFFKSLFKLFR
jgi:serine/threonine-protein kinase